MRVLSAAEALTPAIERTKATLFRPFRKGRSWKLAATAYLCRMGTVFLPFPLIYLFFLPVAKTHGSMAVGGLIAGIVLFTALLTYLFDLGSRLQFAFFDIVVHRGEFVAPAWRKYSARSRGWTALKVVAGLALAALSTVPVRLYTDHMRTAFEILVRLPPGQPPPPEFMATFFAVYGIILVVIGPYYLISSLLSDFVVPFLALEPITVKESLRRTLDLARREPGQLALYTLLKTVLSLAIYMGALIAWEIAIVLCSLLLGGMAALLGYLLHLAGVPLALLSVLGIILGVTWYIFVTVYVLLLTVGTVMTFLDVYGVYFLAGRYLLLGEALDRTEPPPGFTYLDSRSIPPPLG